jgi:8-amino-7-oxononanoate synthase
MMETQMSNLLSHSGNDGAKRLFAKGLATDLLSRERNVAPKNGSVQQALSLDSLPEEVYDVNKFPEQQTISDMSKYFVLNKLQNNYFCCHSDISRDTVTVGGQHYLNFSGYNYLGIGGDPRVAAAVRAAVDQYGTSASASRIASGNTDLHEVLETEIAQFLGVEACVVTVGGYQTNVSTIAYLCGRNDLILHDELVHNSIITGCVLSGARRIPFPHNDYAALEVLLKDNRLAYRRVLILTEGVYSMDGDIPDIVRLVQIKTAYKALLMVDEAHSLGVIGERGAGVTEYCNLSPGSIDILMGTLSKTFASCGGFIAGQKKFIEMLKYLAPGLVLYSAGISPPNTAAALMALRILREEPQRVQKLRDNARFFVSASRQVGFDTGMSHDSAVVPVILRDGDLALQLVHRLMTEDRICVHAMLYPAVAKDMVRLRFFLSSSHTEQQLAYTVERVSTHLREIRRDRGTPGMGLTIT